jgi:hypothetical protein
VSCSYPQKDCDDSSGSVNPGSPEICENGTDDDCNGWIDDEDPACEAPPWQAHPGPANTVSGALGNPAAFRTAPLLSGGFFLPAVCLIFLLHRRYRRTEERSKA